jgi:outer membrane protein OmpA-like peptidoglycan-associated protein
MLDPAQASGDRKVIQDVPLASSTGTTSKHTVGQVMRLNNLIFQVSKSKIDPDSYPELDVVVNMMKENTSMIIQLEGHTDYQGNANDNMRLSQLRVAAVKNYIVSKKIAKNRIKTKAFGGTQPLSREDTPEAHRVNRRVELRILEN